MASRLGTSGRQISDIETGKRIPRDEIRALAGLYGADRATRRQLAQVTADLRDEPAPARAVITRGARRMQQRTAAVEAASAQIRVFTA